MKVNGYCPMGCGPSLVVVDAELRCDFPACPNPGKVHELLQDPETEHVVDFTDEGYTTQHPLRERGEDLFGCTLHNLIAEHFDGPPVDPGRYRVTYAPHDPTSQSFRSDAHPFTFERVTG
jgi:hypothetical protein